MAKSKTKAKKKKERKGPYVGLIPPFGRPPVYKTAAEFRAMCMRYFESLKRGGMPNIAGLCLFLGIHRDTWYSYSKKRSDFTDTVKAIEYAIESVWLDRLPKPGAIGVIFYLKNKFTELYKDRTAGESEENPLYTKHITGMRVVKDRGTK